MATREEIKKAILAAAGNPASGVIVEYVDRFADAVVALDAPKRDVDVREKRVIVPGEVR